MKRRSWRRRLGVISVGLVVLGSVLWRVSALTSWQLVGEIVPRIETTEPVVALTFDDGPVPEATLDVLEQLRTHGVRATFFLVGEDIEKYPDTARAIVAAGHELGNHSYSHSRMMVTTTSFVRGELDETDALIRSVGYGGLIPFRAPYGRKLVALPLVLAESGRTHVTWDVAPDDEAPDDPDVIVRRSLDDVRPGSIILLHVMFKSRAASRKAVTPIIEGVLSRGLRFVTISELLARRR